ncbi:MAG: argininosuccinate synthase [Phycisphaerales bacterium]|nr:argininosuccinate synthase [Phycisphaerales bacterium]MCB9857505.1 argininosuccinate synthase [Phycisphaerales bacterium]MCB9864510.1 argininosuccinate synthase [Phycisphaerales bacterium]
MKSKQCVLAYSGGLDTSAIVYWLVEQGYEVHAVLVDVGQNDDFDALCKKAIRHGAASAVVRDAKPAMCATILPFAAGLGATYEGCYRLGTALARPFIAWEQVKRAKELGGATLVHGATGKGNDQIRFEFAYRSLAPECPVLAPWKVWSLKGREDLVNYLKQRGCTDSFEVTKTYSLDENLWHLSIEGGALEDPSATVDVESIIAAVRGDSTKAVTQSESTLIRIEFDNGVPVGLNGQELGIGGVIDALNQKYAGESWAWDMLIENRFTGIKSRGVYINPAAKLLHMAADSLARCAMNKPTYDQYVSLGRKYGAMVYRGEYFSDQRLVLEGAARVLMAKMTGTATIRVGSNPYIAGIDISDSIFRSDLATFEKSSFDQSSAKGFIDLTWLSSIGRPFTEAGHEHALDAARSPSSDLCVDQSMHGGGLVSTSV